MKKEVYNKPYPYTLEMLQYFEKEILDAGGVDELMIQKKALIQNGESTIIATYYDIEEYKEKFLIGEYEPLRPYYDTKVPYVFWSFMFDALVRSGAKAI